MRLSRSFTLAELTSTSTGMANTPNPTEVANLQLLVDKVLQPLRDAIGAPIIVSSGFRSERVNRAVGGASTSQHRLGQAADISTPAMNPKALARFIIDKGLPFDQLIQEFGRWVHVSYGPRNRRQVLTAVTRNGKTVYLDGLQ